MVVISLHAAPAAAEAEAVAVAGAKLAPVPQAVAPAPALAPAAAPPALVLVRRASIRDGSGFSVTARRKSNSSAGVGNAKPGLGK